MESQPDKDAAEQVAILGEVNVAHYQLDVQSGHQSPSHSQRAFWKRRDNRLISYVHGKMEIGKWGFKRRIGQILLPDPTPCGASPGLDAYPWEDPAGTWSSFAKALFEPFMQGAAYGSRLFSPLAYVRGSLLQVRRSLQA